MSAIVLTSETLIGTPAPGNLEYNGQFFGTDSNASRAQFQRLVLSTSVTASGTSINFTDIPAWVERITIMFIGISSNGASVPTVRLGTVSGIEATGYLGSMQNGTSAVLFTTGFEYSGNLQTAARVYHGAMTLTLQNRNTNTWAGTSIVGLSDGASVGIMGGSKSTASTVTQLRVTFVNGTDVFDAGSINIMYEG